MKRIFVTGSTGFVGGAIVDRLLAEGYQLRLCLRNPHGRPERAGVEYVQGDFSTDHDASVWKERLSGCDGLVNAVGIIRETRRASFEALHYQGPAALFQAARACKIEHVVQISALGSDDGAETPYHLTKRRADEALRADIPSAVVLRPSLIVGAGGQSTKLFSLLAHLPVLPLPAGGRFLVQPVHIGDLAEGVVSLFRRWPSQGCTVDVAGPQPMTLADMLQAFRRHAGFLPSLVLSIPLALMKLVAALRIGMMTPDTLRMLERGNTGDPKPFERLTGLAVRAALPSQASMTAVALSVLRPLLRMSVAFLWIWTAVVTFFFFDHATSLVWLEDVGIPTSMTSFLLYAACVFDLVLGLMLFSPFRRLSYGIQLITVLFYSLILLVQLPEFWLHPFGPVSKNVPLLVLTLVGWVFDGAEESKVNELPAS